MLSSLSKAPFARSLCLSSALRFARPGAGARRSLLGDSRRTFMTTASLAEEGQPTKEKEATKDEAEKDPSGARKHTKVPYKRPYTSWQNFYHQYLKEHKVEGEPYTAYAAEASALWKAMTAEEKARYGSPEEERAEYKRLSSEYRAQQKAEKKAAKPEREPRREPKNPMSAYNLFVKKNYDKSSTESFWSQNTTLAKRWRDMSASEKDEYKQGAETKAAAAKPQREPKREPKKRGDTPMSAYNVFVKEHYDKSSTESFWSQTTTLAKRWREMPASEKDEYKKRAIEIHEKRKAEAAEK